MKTFDIYWSSLSHGCVRVEANTEEEAKAKVLNSDVEELAEENSEIRVHDVQELG